MSIQARLVESFVSIFLEYTFIILFLICFLLYIAQSFAGGTGLGLYSLAKRSDALGGYYGVRARKDGIQGSVFWFAIPYKPDLVNAKLHIRQIEKIKSSSRSIKSISSKSLVDTNNNNSRRPSITDGNCLNDSINEVEIPVRENELDSTLHLSQHSEKSQKGYKDLSGAVGKPEDRIKDEVEFEFHYASEEIIGYNMSGRSLISDTDLDSIQGNEEILPLGPLNILLVDDSQAILKLTGKNLLYYPINFHLHLMFVNLIKLYIVYCIL